MTRLRVLVLADTHLRRAWPNRTVPEVVWEEAAAADVILHAGDVVEPEHLEELTVHAPVHAVLGNNDHELVGALPETLTVDLGGLSVGMIHDSGQARGREARMRELFPTAALVVFGHSHVPWNAAGLDGQWLFNPGSPTERRRQPHRSFGRFEVVGGGLVDPTIVYLDDEGRPMASGT